MKEIWSLPDVIPAPDAKLFSSVEWKALVTAWSEQGIVCDTADGRVLTLSYQPKDQAIVNQLWRVSRRGDFGPAVKAYINQLQKA